MPDQVFGHDHTIAEAAPAAEGVRGAASSHPRFHIVRKGIDYENR